MKNHVKTSFILASVFVLMISFQNCGKSQLIMGETELASLGTESQKIRSQSCARCHEGAQAVAEPVHIMDDQFLIQNRWLIPGDPGASPIYQALFNNMPLNAPRLSDSEIAVMESWIRSLLNDGKSPANLAISESPLFAFGNVLSGGSAEHTFTLTNTGERDAVGLLGTGLNAPFEYKGGSFPGTGGTCQLNLTPNQSCTFVVSYFPSAQGSHSDMVEVLYLDRNAALGTAPSKASINLSGSSTGLPTASLTLSDGPTFDFGFVSVGTTAEKILTLRNVGAASASALSAQALTNGFEFKGGAYPGTGGTCASSLASKASCALVVQFKPTVSGTARTDFSISYRTNSLTPTTSIGLVGSGSGGGAAVYYSDVRAILTSSCQHCHDGDWGTTYAQLLAFKRGGAATAAIIPGSNSSRFIVRISGTSGGSQMGTGSYGSLSASNRDKIISWVLAGAPNDPAAAPASLSINNGPTFDYGSVVSGQTKDQTFTVSNSGATDATSLRADAMTPPFGYKGGSYPGTGGTCGATLIKGTSCKVVVTFSPTSAVVSTGQIQLRFAGGSTATTLVSRALKGTGAGGALANLKLGTLSPLDFGVVSVNTSSDKAISVSNQGSASATGMSGAALADPFSYVGGRYPGTGGTCGVSLAAGSTCTITVRYLPSANGVKNQAFTLNYNDGQSAQTLSLLLTGTGVGGGVPVYYSDVKAVLERSACNTCHSSDWGTTYAGLLAFKFTGQSGPAIVPGDVTRSRFVNRVTGTSLGVQMGVSDPSTGTSYGTLSAVDKQTLLDWIAQGAPNDPVGSISQSFRPLVGDRYYITSVLYKVFGENQTTISKVRTALTARADLYGGACHLQDVEWETTNRASPRPKNYPLKDYCVDANTDEARVEAEPTHDVSTVNEGTRQAVCMRLLDQATNTANALSLTGLNSTSPFDDVSITKAFQRFYPGDRPSSQVVSSLAAIGTEAISSTRVVPETGRPKAFEGWRFIYLTLCLSSGWQAP